MKIVGIIAEYNPFHNGHLYQLNQLRSQTGADYIITAISGDFVQRGEPAIYDKYTRTQMALSCGVDLVLELPVCFATGSARDFASCGVALFDRLGVVDFLGFGSEGGDSDLLYQAAQILEKEPEEFREQLQALLKKGFSFPQARALALESYFPWADLLSSPNNILGIEYMRALMRRGSSIRPVTIRRTGQSYHDTKPVEKGTAASASAIRKALKETNLSLVSDQVPEPVFQILRDQSCPLFCDDLTGLLNSRLLELSRSPLPGQDNPFSVYADLSPELAARLKHNLLDFAAFSDRIMQLKTRGYTYTRISRALLHLLLGITEKETSDYRKKDYVSYARILGFRRSCGPLLSHIKAASSLPLITKTADAQKILDTDGLFMLQTDFYASHLYQSVVFAKSGRKIPNEYTRSVIIM